jgi:hypothetical protein
MVQNNHSSVSYKPSREPITRKLIDGVEIRFQATDFMRLAKDSAAATDGTLGAASN